MKKINTVLLIDDDEVTNATNEHMILSMDVCDSLHAFPNAIQGLSYFNGVSSIHDIPELVLVDLKMPIIDGFEFLKAFEKSFSLYRKKVKMIVLTISHKSEDKQIAFDFGFDDYIVKPLTVGKLKDVLVKHFTFPSALSEIA